MFALMMCEDRISVQPRRAEIIQGLKHLPDQIKEVLSVDNTVLKLAEELYQQKSLLVMGGGYNYATCLEGALVRCQYVIHNSKRGESKATGLIWDVSLAENQGVDIHAQ